MPSYILDKFEVRVDSVERNGLEETRKMGPIRGGPLTFGNMIESIRFADKVTQVELAGRMGMSRATFVT